MGEKYWEVWLKCGTIPAHFKHLTKKQISDRKWKQGKNSKKYFIIHHLNHNHKDNRPENLYLMTFYQHRIWHTTGKNNYFYGKKHTDETRKKISKNHADVSGEKHPWFGRKHSDKTKKKMSTNHADVSKAKNPNALFTDKQYEQIYNDIYYMWKQGHTVKTACMIECIIFNQTKNYGTFEKIYYRMKEEKVNGRK